MNDWISNHKPRYSGPRFVEKIIGTLNEKVTELWAVLDKDGAVKWTRGGSSTRPKLMVYSSKAKAERVLASPWIKQVIPDRSNVRIERVYLAPARDDKL